MTGGFPAWLDRGDWQSRTMFPNCWDGENLTTATPLSNTHMAFRSDADGRCPPSHPVRIPQLFVEVNYPYPYPYLYPCPYIRIRIRILIRIVLLR